MPVFCEKHRAAVFDRGGRRLLGHLEHLVSVDWERVRDDFSTGRVIIAEPTKGCVELLEKIAVNRHELVIWRGQERVWEGPITLIGRHADTFELEARDVVHYLYRTVMHAEYDSAAYWSPNNEDPNKVFIDNVEPVVDRAVRIIRGELNREKELLDPPVNVVPFLTAVRYPDISKERKANRRTMPYSGTVYDELESMGQNGGLDYTAVGRRIIVNDTRVIIGQTAVVTEKDFIGEVSVTSYGMDGATRAFTTGDQGMFGVSGGVDPYFGEWEIVEQMFDEDSEEPPTQNALDNAAEYNLFGKNPPPTRVRLPENTLLNPNGVLSMSDLVPGVHMPLRASLFSIELVQMQKLDTVKVHETGTDGEQITISMVPATKTIIA